MLRQHIWVKISGKRHEKWNKFNLQYCTESVSIITKKLNSYPEQLPNTIWRTTYFFGNKSQFCDDYIAQATPFSKSPALGK